ncbi:MAG: glycosyltransferase family 4 protein [Chloroflexota bacterium]
MAAPETPGMNILFLVPYTPTLVRTRPYNLLRALAQRGHRLTLATLFESTEERQALDTWVELGVQVLAFPLKRSRKVFNLAQGLLSSDPLQASYCWQPQLAQAVTDLLWREDFDVVHIEHLRGARYGLHVKKKIHNLKIPIIWDSVDCISYLFEQASQKSRSIFGKLVTRLELPRTRSLEARLLGQFQHILITSPIDKQALLNLLPPEGFTAPISVLSNGADLEYFAPDANQVRDTASIVFSGKMSYHANITMADFLVNEIMPLVWSKYPDVKLNIVGKDPPEKVKRFARNPAINITGSVADMRPYLRRSTLAIVPLIYGAGSQLKMLEALACGTPVVATPQAVSALQDIQPGEDLLTAKDAAGLAQAILRLLKDEELRQRIAANGLAYVRAHHDWNAIAGQLEGIYQQVIQSPDPA